MTAGSWMNPDDRTAIVVCCAAVWPAKTTCSAWGVMWTTHGCKLTPGHTGGHICACNRRPPEGLT